MHTSPTTEPPVATRSTPPASSSQPTPAGALLAAVLSKMRHDSRTVRSPVPTNPRPQDIDPACE
jgi:hypothetical protein